MDYVMKIPLGAKWRFNGLVWTLTLIQALSVLLFGKYTAHGCYSSYSQLQAILNFDKVSQ
jgi:hypothetical protein